MSKYKYKKYNNYFKNNKKKNKKPIEWYFRKNDGIDWFHVIDGYAINKRLRELYRNKIITDET